METPENKTLDRLYEELNIKCPEKTPFLWGVSRSQTSAA